MSTAHRRRVVLALMKKNFPDLLARAKAIYNGLLANPSLFPNPNPTLIALLALIQAFDQAQQLALTHAHGAAAARDLKAAAVITALETARAYVQQLVDAATPEQGVVLIEAAAMKVGLVTVRTKPFLQAAQRAPGAPVRVVANVALLTAGLKGQIFIDWEYSADGGKTWLSAPTTSGGTTDIPGLTPLVTYFFRVNATSPKATTVWSQSVELFVR